MIPRGSRLVLWSIALLLTTSLFMKGRATTGKGEGAALLRAGEGTLKVRLAGDFPRPGLYLFPDGTSPETAIKMTVPGVHFHEAFHGPSSVRLASGDIVTLKLESGKTTEFSMGKMGAKERMLLRIPLDPDQLSAEEWDLLPGIGPVLSARIVADRQRNGAFGSLQGVLRVPGIGPVKVKIISKFF